MRLLVNGETRQVEEGTGLPELLREAELAPLHVAIEINRELVRRTDYGARKLHDGDQIEIVTFVGGG